MTSPLSPAFERKAFVHHVLVRHSAAGCWSGVFSTCVKVALPLSWLSTWFDESTPAPVEQQDYQITHGAAPLVDDEGSIYFFSGIALTNAYERFVEVRK